MMQQYVPIALWTILLAIPLVFLVRRSGLSKLWMLLLVVPFLGGVALLWVISFMKWPETTDFAEEPK